MDFNALMAEFIKNIGWAIVASLAMSFSLGILLFVYDKLTPRLDEMEELKKGNIAVAIVLAAVILSYGFVVGMIVHGGTVINIPK